MEESFDRLSPNLGKPMKRTNKPQIEKRRRERINASLSQLKALVLTALRRETTDHSKLEKADILEMTVRHLRGLQDSHMHAAAATDATVAGKFRQGYSECATEVTRYLASVDGVTPDVRHRLLRHLSATCMRYERDVITTTMTSSPTATVAPPIKEQLPVATAAYELPGTMMSPTHVLTSHGHVMTSPNQVMTSPNQVMTLPNQVMTSPHHGMTPPNHIMALSNHVMTSQSVAPGYIITSQRQVPDVNALTLDQLASYACITSQGATTSPKHLRGAGQGGMVPVCLVPPQVARPPSQTASPIQPSPSFPVVDPKASQSCKPQSPQNNFCEKLPQRDINENELVAPVCAERVKHEAQDVWRPW